MRFGVRRDADCALDFCVTLRRMPAPTGKSGNGESKPAKAALYCPSCAVEVTDPLVCGDCSAVICRACGTPLESADELGIG
jgi:hypothetical protein